jgi:hypothetical protein
VVSLVFLEFVFIFDNIEESFGFAPEERVEFGGSGDRDTFEVGVAEVEKTSGWLAFLEHAFFQLYIRWNSN